MPTACPCRSTPRACPPPARPWVQHGPARQGPLRAGVRRRGSLARKPPGSGGQHRTPSGLRAYRAGHARAAPAVALRAVGPRPARRALPLLLPVVRRGRAQQAGGGDTGAPQLKVNPSPGTCTTPIGWPNGPSAWLDTLGAEDDWFCWMSFPDPHHPWDPPASELAGSTGGTSTCRPAIPGPRSLPEGPGRQTRPLAGVLRRVPLQPGRWPTGFVPAAMTDDQVSRSTPSPTWKTS